MLERKSSTAYKEKLNLEISLREPFEIPPCPSSHTPPPSPIPRSLMSPSQYSYIDMISDQCKESAQFWWHRWVRKCMHHCKSITLLPIRIAVSVKKMREYFRSYSYPHFYLIANILLLSALTIIAIERIGGSSFTMKFYILEDIF